MYDVSLSGVSNTRSEPTGVAHSQQKSTGPTIVRVLLHLASIPVIEAGHRCTYRQTHRHPAAPVRQFFVCLTVETPAMQHAGEPSPRCLLFKASRKNSAHLLSQQKSNKPVNGTAEIHRGPDRTPAHSEDTLTDLTVQTKSGRRSPAPSEETEHGGQQDKTEKRQKEERQLTTRVTSPNVTCMIQAVRTQNADSRN